MRAASRLAAALAIFLAVLLPHSSPVLAVGVTLTAEPLLAGHVRPGAWAAVRVHVSNDGLDVAIRRVSVGRRDFALARAWSGARWQQWRRPAARSAPVGGMLAAKDRAAGTRARGAPFDR